jgi:hypothetical protein
MNTKNVLRHFSVCHFLKPGLWKLYKPFITIIFSILSTDKTTIFLWLYIKSARIFTNSSSEVGETLKNNNFMSSRCCFYFGWWASFEPTSGLNGVDIASQDENVASDYFRTTISGKKLPICTSMSALRWSGTLNLQRTIFDRF